MRCAALRCGVRWVALRWVGRWQAAIEPGSYFAQLEEQVLRKWAAAGGGAVVDGACLA
jgi:hypothetical protein